MPGGVTVRAGGVAMPRAATKTSNANYPYVERADSSCSWSLLQSCGENHTFMADMRPVVSTQLSRHSSSAEGTVPEDAAMQLQAANGPVRPAEFVVH